MILTVDSSSKSFISFFPSYADNNNNNDKKNSKPTCKIVAENAHEKEKFINSV